MSIWYAPMDSRYSIQQVAINEIARKYNLFAHRLSSHSKETHNAVFLYQDAGEIGNEYPLWSFSNTNRSGQYDLSIGKVGKNKWIDLSSEDWKKRLDASVQLSVCEQMERLHVNSFGGYLALPEVDEVLNEINRQKIIALQKMYGRIYLFKLSPGKGDPFVEYTGQKIYNHPYDCAVPEITDAVNNLFHKLRNPTGKDNVTGGANVSTSFLLLDEVTGCGGITLIWR